MMRGRDRIRVSGLMIVAVAMLAGGVGCASKQVASTSGDQFTTMKSKAETGGPVESIKQEPMASTDAGSSLESPPSTGAKDASPLAQAPGSSSAPSSGLTPGVSPSASAGTPEGGLGDIYFDFDQYTIRSDAQTVLNANARWLRMESGKSVLIEGHCDERGTLAYNLVLGEKRAKSAKRYLEDLGIPGSRLHTTSYGEVRPICRERDEACYSKNRRAHFVVQ